MSPPHEKLLDAIAKHCDALDQQQGTPLVMELQRCLEAATDAVQRGLDAADSVKAAWYALSKWMDAQT